MDITKQKGVGLMVVDKFFVMCIEVWTFLIIVL